ncbi:hypothetical protein BDV95DRAFT_47392 [Massariosphaeria phaeospora]|uniref:Uncharacterized protein n=1 Tax=Massariosphaeria phaeospora TaxID=100035 RepID=A0A7C8MAD1_9PLEO|nr:hypothetical protein BDV95DRAFT_47392 [Massariosphaeria phaeospora]
MHQALLSPNGLAAIEWRIECAAGPKPFRRNTTAFAPQQLQPAAILLWHASGRQSNASYALHHLRAMFGRGLDQLVPASTETDIVCPQASRQGKVECINLKHAQCKAFNTMQQLSTHEERAGFTVTCGSVLLAIHFPTSLASRAVSILFSPLSQMALISTNALATTLCYFDHEAMHNRHLSQHQTATKVC